LNIPAALKHIEVAGIMQGRKLQCCTFNEFRAKLQLKKLDSFEDFSDLPEVQNGLKELYETPDAVELYPGLTVEKMKPAGMHMPYTMGRAILSDAVNLLRNGKCQHYYKIYYFPTNHFIPSIRRSILRH
jgi:Animal haem peroxidase